MELSVVALTIKSAPSIDVELSEPVSVGPAVGWTVSSVTLGIISLGRYIVSLLEGSVAFASISRMAGAGVTNTWTVSSWSELKIIVGGSVGLEVGAGETGSDEDG